VEGKPVWLSPPPFWKEALMILAVIIILIIQAWIILGLGSLHFFSLIFKQKVQITNTSVILLSVIYGPITYGIMINFYKEPAK